MKLLNLVEQLAKMAHFQSKQVVCLDQFQTKVSNITRQQTFSANAFISAE